MSFCNICRAMTKSSKLVAVRRNKVLLVRRRKDGLWMFPGGRRQDNETDRDCIRREIKEKLPMLKIGRLQLWKEVTIRNKISGRKMSDAIFVAKSAKGRLDIVGKKELDRAVWREPHGVRLTPTSRYIRNRLFSR